jgi:CheY-like chemotaxis protein
MKNSTPGRILIMDDYPTIRLSLALLLQRMGYTVDQASSGNQALEIYDKTVENCGTYQAVITDLTVPGAMGGKVLVSELHKRNPDLCVIVSSGYSEEIEIAQYRLFGFAGVLHKPYSQDELQDVLGTVLAVF